MRSHQDIYPRQHPDTWYQRIVQPLVIRVPSLPNNVLISIRLHSNVLSGWNSSEWLWFSSSYFIRQGEPLWKESLLTHKDIPLGQKILLFFISIVAATKETIKPWALCMHTHTCNLALVSSICISSYLHVPRSWAMISPTEDLCHVPEYIDGGQQVPTVAGPILRDFHKVLEYFW